ncbi:DNA-formamidopyrimidine glycosylase family protein [Dyadobacter bucti]|uniref:DNA-formamidopyrimidine glycosylase family protein n=1 Tax=Dyadobacter bucti TaxID=2572203 RepID=UPI001109B6A5|nr:DNA-formamidopyrimidine glycosylase family protein [Dyadobacter bucti]
MPEIPELNVLKNNLLKRFKGKKVEEFRILWKKNIKTPEEEFAKTFQGAKLMDITREGKILLLRFDNDQILGIHLRLTGRAFLIPEEEDTKFPIMMMLFKKDGFGINDFMGQAQPEINPTIPDVPDVLSKDFTLDYLKAIIAKRSNKAIKTVLTEQKLLRGMGNAYTDESLWAAKIDPRSIASKIPDAKLKEFLDCLHEVYSDAENEIDIATGKDSLMIEKREFMKVHNSKRKQDPEGNDIEKGEVAKAKTYWSKAQQLYE